MNKGIDKKTVKRGMLPYLFLALAIIGIFYVVNVRNKVVNILTYDEFIEVLDNREIEELELVARGNAHTYEATGKLKKYKDKLVIVTNIKMINGILNVNNK